MGEFGREKLSPYYKDTFSLEERKFGKSSNSITVGWSIIRNARFTAKEILFAKQTESEATIETDQI